MAPIDLRVRDKDGLATFLGWFSLGLGAAQAAAPRLMCRFVGSSGEGMSRTVMRVMGLRELTQGVGILTRPRPTAWIWSRVAGDALDLSLLGLTALRTPHRARTAFAIATTIPIAVADVQEARFLSQKQGEPRSAMRVRKAVTINRSRPEVEEAWTAATELRHRVDAAGAAVSFLEAPASQGTELVVEFEYDPPAGDLGAAAQKLTGKDLATRLADDLRRLKQQIETGQVVRSDGASGGHLLAEHLKQRAAQPLAERQAVR